MLGAFPKRDDRFDNQRQHTRADAEKGVLHDAVIHNMAQKKRDQEDDDKGRQNDAERRGSGAEDACRAVADKGRGIDRDRSGRGFRNGNNVGNLLFFDQLTFFRRLVFDQRDHGIAAAEGKCADFQKNQK